MLTLLFLIFGTVSILIGFNYYKKAKKAYFKVEVIEGYRNLAWVIGGFFIVLAFIILFMYPNLN